MVTTRRSLVTAFVVTIALAISGCASLSTEGVKDFFTSEQVKAERAAKAKAEADAKAQAEADRKSADAQRAKSADAERAAKAKAEAEKRESEVKAKAEREAAEAAVLAAKTKADNLAKCQGWSKLTAEQKKSKGYFCWMKVGGDPFVGTPEQALLASGWPKDVQVAFLDLIKNKTSSDTTIEEGDFFEWGTFAKAEAGKPAKAHTSVIASFGPAQPAEKFVVLLGGYQYTIMRAKACNNYNGMKPHKIVVPLPPAKVDPPKPAATLVQAGPCGGSQFRTVTVMVWNPSSFTDAHTQKFAGALREAETQGRAYRGDQFSRAMGKELRASGLPTASIDAQVRVFAVSPETVGTANGVGELLGTVTVSGGKGQINVPVGVASTRVLRFEFPDDGFSSPLKSPGTGKRDLLVFPHDDQRTPDKRWADYACAPFVHAAVVKK